MVFVFWKLDSGASFLRTFILASTILYKIDTAKAEAPYNYIGNETVVHTAKSCFNKQYSLIQVWFRDAKPPFPLISVCYDDANVTALWSVHQIFGEKMKNKEPPVKNNPKWRQDEIDMTINVTASYNGFRKAIAYAGVNITKYNFDGNFIEKGHLAPKRDQLTVAEMNATFYFINASPQWKSINGGNWNKLEMKLRELAENNSATFTVWTGSYGILKLDTRSNDSEPVEIWLGTNITGEFVKKVPVNQLTWKVIHDPEKSTAVAFVVVNNPWITSIPPEDILCEDVCDQLKWVDWNRTNITEGYTYCCTVNSLYEQVKYAPYLGNLPLLFSHSVSHTAAPLSISLLLLFTFLTSIN